MGTTAKLFGAALLAAATALAVPATRQVLLSLEPMHTFGVYPFFRDHDDDDSPLVHIEMAIGWNNERPCLTVAEVQRSAPRAQLAESLAAAAEESPYDAYAWRGGERLALLDAALRYAPADETTLARRASILLDATSDAHGGTVVARRALAAADDFVTAYPDNGYAHHLRAAALGAMGDQAGAVKAWRAGNRAPRFDRRYGPALARIRRWNRQRGELPLLTSVRGPSPSSADDFSLHAAAGALVRARCGEPDTCRAVIEAGSRWLRDCGDFRSQRLGRWLLRDGLLRGKQVDRESDAQRNARLLGGGQALGLPTSVVDQARQPIQLMDPNHPLDRVAVGRHLRGYGAWRAFALTCLLMAWLMLTIACLLMPGLRSVVPWSGGQLLLAWSFALWPFIGCAAFMSAWYFAQDAVSADVWLRLSFGGVDLPWLAATAMWLPLASLSRRFGLRGDDVGPRRRQFLRRAGAPLYAATGALLLLITAAACVPAARHGQRAAEEVFRMVATDYQPR